MEPKDYVAVSFSGPKLVDVVAKMIDFLNALKGLNIVNVQENPPEQKPAIQAIKK